MARKRRTPSPRRTIDGKFVGQSTADKHMAVSPGGENYVTAMKRRKRKPVVDS